MSKINPNSDRDYIDNLDISNAKKFPLFVTELEFDKFRHINKLEVKFHHPISVISGVNRVGKSTILMALACSHVRFMKRNPNNGTLERQTWSSLMQFTSKDIQSVDWTYYMSYKTGAKKGPKKRGQRKASTKKWNGIAKKEGQFDERLVVMTDLDRCLPARFYSSSLFNKSKNAHSNQIATSKSQLIAVYMSYILEEQFTLMKLASHQDKDVFTYQSNHEYSSYNAATGEETLIRIILDAVEAEKKSLILIDEIELGLHPKIQRRLMDVLYHIAREDEKQFILTTHSATILSSVPNKSRIFLDKKGDGNIVALHGISVNQALSKMDSLSYPLIDLYCEDDIAEKVIQCALREMQKTDKDIMNVVNIIKSGASNIVYSDFSSHLRLMPHKKVKTGCGCILDGDQVGDTRFKEHSSKIHFLLGNDSPEKILVSAYEEAYPNTSLNYHINSSNNHSLFDKMVECCDDILTKEDAVTLCCQHYFSLEKGKDELEKIINYIQSRIDEYSISL